MTRLPYVVVASISLACITQQNRRFLAVYPVGEERWAVAAEEARPAVSLPDPPGGRLLLADAKGSPESAVRLRPAEEPGAEHLVIYQIQVPFFADGDPTNDAVLAHARRPALYPGGDLRGVLEHLEYVRSLGVNAIWLSPIFESPSEHGYDATNYYEISPSLAVPGDRAASRELFREVVRRAHALGLKVILDVSLNHASPTYDLVNGNPHGARLKATPPRQADELTFGGQFAYWDHDDADTREFLEEVAVHWIRDEGVDGYRLDYARGAPPSFWRKLHARLNAIRPDSFLLAEVFPGPAEGLGPIAEGYQADAAGEIPFDSLLDFPTCFAVTAVFNDTRIVKGLWSSVGVFGGDRSPVRLERLLQSMEARYPPGARPTFFLDNHDLGRFANYSSDPRRLLAAFAFLSTLSGHVVLYYGTEAALRGATRQPMPWGELDPKTVDAFRAVIAMRNDHPSLQGGARLPLQADDRTLVMAKVGADERALVGVNLSAREVVVEVEVGTLLDDGAGGATVLGTTTPQIREGRVRWTLPPVSTSVYLQPAGGEG